MSIKSLLDELPTQFVYGKKLFTNLYILLGLPVVLVEEKKLFINLYIISLTLKVMLVKGRRISF